MAKTLSLLDKNIHDRSQFSCEENTLTEYLKKYANQDQKENISACYVLADNYVVIGYYTISTGSIPKDLVPSEYSKKLGKYEHLPIIKIGRLARDIKYKNKNIGQFLLVDALKRALDISKNIGSFAVLVDPINDVVRNWYAQYGFVSALDNNQMIINMKSIEMTFRA